jgi:hypothetical protein
MRCQFGHGIRLIYDETMTLTFDAHSDGKVIVPDEPCSLPVNTRLRITVEAIAETSRVTQAPRVFKPLSIRIDPELSHAIALDPEFDIEES